ncbi:MAG: HAD family hydrolase, partial [bacterium]
ELYQSMLKDTLAHYLIHASDHTAPYPGILELLKQLRDEGYTLGVVSNKADEAVKDLCRTYFPDCFEAVIGQKPHVRKKPAPDTLNEAARLLNVSRREILYVGDSEVDIETSRNAGVEIVLVDWGFRDREELIQAGALDLVSDPQELYAYIKSKS